MKPRHHEVARDTYPGQARLQNNVRRTEVVSCAKLKYKRWQIFFQRGDGKSFTPPKGKLRTENFHPKKVQDLPQRFLEETGKVREKKVSLLLM